MPFPGKTIKAFAAWDKTAQDTQGLACHVKDWEVINISEADLSGTFLFCTIVNDYQCRFMPGDYVSTNRILKFDKLKGLIETRNSLYCLTGNGEKLQASVLEVYK